MKHLKSTILTLLSLILFAVALILVCCEETDPTASALISHVAIDKTLGILAGIAAYWIYRKAEKIELQNEQS